MKVLVVGGAGYIGGAVIDTIQQCDPDVELKVYDSLVYERQFLKKVPFVRGDIRDHEKLQPLIEQSDVIVWLAAIVGDPACSLNEELTQEVNADSVEWLASVAGDRKIIFMSTCSVYGKNEESMLSETSSTNPLSSYARTKLEAEGHLAYSNAIIFRLGTIFGLGDAFARPRFDLVVNVMTADMVKNGKLTVYGGLQSRPLVHAKDIARFIYEAMYRNIVGIFNITNYNMTIGELAGIIQNIVGGDIRVIPEDQSDERDYTVSTDKLTNIFKTSFAYALEPAIGEIARVIERGRIKDHKDPVFNNKLNLEGQL